MKAALKKLPIPGTRTRVILNGQVFAAVDLGSNSFHMIVARHEHGELAVIDRIREMVRLAAGLDAAGNISAEARQRALETLQRFGQRLRGIPAHNVRAAATNTLREARNPADFLKQAETALGHPIEVISGHEEARLVYLGVSRGLAEGGRRLVIDIGGGSTELVIGEGSRLLHLESLQIGCVTLSNRFFPDGRITEQQFKEAETAASLELESIKGAFMATGWDEAVGSSGSVRALQEIAEAQGWEFRGVSSALIRRVRDVLLAAGHVERVNVPGLSRERNPVFPAAVAIIAACFRQLKLRRIRVSPLALREGLLYDLLGRLEHKDPREVGIRAMASRYGVDPRQAERVRRTALAFFDQVAGTWALDADHRRVLEWAGRIHEIGLAISHTDYHQHGAYLLTYSDMNGFSRLEQLVLAALVRNHRRKLSRSQFAGLPNRLVKPVMRLCVLLRLAVLMHRSRSGSVDARVLVEADGRTLRMRFPSRWLTAHPLTQIDLKLEHDFLDQIGYRLLFD